VSEQRRSWIGIGRHDLRSRVSMIDPSRVANFSDGVFAVAITLLVLSIPIPDLSGAHVNDLGDRLKDVRPEIAAYLLSFAVIGRFWISHHALLGSIGKPDRRLAGLNLIYLAVIVFIPIPTELVGRYGNEFAAFAWYAVTISLAILASLAMQLYVIRNDLLKADAPRYRTDDLVIATLLPVSIFLGSIGLVALAGDTSIGYWSWLTMIVVNPSVRAVPAPSR
jgi:uncharacterized membrane protein